MGLIPGSVQGLIDSAKEAGSTFMDRLNAASASGSSRAEEVGRRANVEFMGQSFSVAELRELGIDDEKAVQLRSKILERNKKIKSATGKVYPMVLVPHHQVRIWRTVRHYDSEGNYERSEVFRVEPNNGSRDILGIKFNYSYDNGSTSFTMTLNNARGKNKGRFASGDLVEFYFNLVDEMQLRDAEKGKGSSLFIRNKEKIDGLPICFTGMLDKFSAQEGFDGLTINWTGRSGGYILSEMHVNCNYPLDSKSIRLQVGDKIDTNAVMCYEEIIWDMIAFNTGMVIGELDLGSKMKQRPDGTQPTEEEQNAMMDIMAPAGQAGKNNNLRFEDDFLPELEKILEQYEYCTFSESVETDTQTQNAGATVSKKPQKNIRWSCLLEYDLLRPKVFGIGESKKKDLYAGYSKALVVNGRTIETIRFREEWAMKVFALQWERVNGNADIVRRAAMVKAQTDRTDATYSLLQVTEEIARGFLKEDPENAGQPVFSLTFYQEIFKKMGADMPNPNSEAFKEWRKTFDSIQRNYRVTIEDATKKKAEIEKNKDYDVDFNAKRRGELWNMEDEAIKPGQFIVIPHVTRKFTGATKYMIEGNDGHMIATKNADGETLPEKRNVLKVITRYSYDQDKNRFPGFTITLSPQAGSSFINIMITSAGIKGNFEVVRGVPNRADAVAQAIENSAPLDVTIVTSDLSQPLDINSYTVSKETEDSVWDKAEVVKADFTADGTVLEQVSKAMKKFFCVVLYVDEFGIAHIRPRYKNLQIADVPKADKERKHPIPPVWGLYAGQPVYPRLFESELSDWLKSVPSSLIVHGQSATKNESIFSKVDHSMLLSLFGEVQRFEDTNESISSREEAKIIAQNMLMDMVRKALTFACKTDLIPELRPGHRIDVFDPNTGVAGRFVIETIEWEYSKDSGMQMAIGMASQSLSSDDALITAAISYQTSSNSGSGEWSKQLSQAINNRMGLFGFPLLRASNVETGKDKSSLEKINKEFADKVLPEFNLGTDGGVIQLIPRQGFETSGKNSSDDGSSSGR